jgi:hypothetical protein
MDSAAKTYRNAQVGLALEAPEATAHWVNCPAYGRYAVTNITAAIRHGRGSDLAQPAITDMWLAYQQILALGCGLPR